MEQIEYDDQITTTGNGLWSQIKTTNPYYVADDNLKDPWDLRLIELENQIKALKIDLKLSRLKILALENKFTKEEISNIRKMIMSEDEASVTLAHSIIENA